jgi:hypothetical protein
LPSSDALTASTTATKDGTKMQFPTANDSLPYAPLQIIDRSSIRTDLAVRWPNDGFRFVDDADRVTPDPTSRALVRLTGLVVAGLLAMAASSALATPAEGAAVPVLEMRVAPATGMPAGPFLD